MKRDLGRRTTTKTKTVTESLILRPIYPDHNALHTNAVRYIHPVYTFVRYLSTCNSNLDGSLPDIAQSIKPLSRSKPQ